jgi:hypothetical protein
MQTFVLHLSHQTETPFFCADLHLQRVLVKSPLQQTKKSSATAKKIDWYFLPC